MVGCLHDAEKKKGDFSEILVRMEAQNRITCGHTARMVYHFRYLEQGTMKKKILVTGGAGFVGSHLCERLIQNLQNEVYSLDNYFTGNEANHVSGVTYIKGDTTDIATLITFRPDMLYHLGEYSRVEQSFDDIETVWRYNKDGIFAVLEFVRQAGCKILYAGSSTKFGDGGLGRSASPYAWTKATNTELVMNYRHYIEFQVAIF